MKHYVYILYSPTRDRYYIGSAVNTESRLSSHNAGATPSTKPRRPWKIVFTREFNLKTEALEYENYLKRMKSRMMIVTLIEE